MIRFYFKGIEIRIYFLFLAVITVATLIDQTGIILFSLIATMIHETGHIAALFMTQNKPKQLCLVAGGMRLKKESEFMPVKSEIWVLSAGCLMNIIAFLTTYSLSFFIMGLSIELKLFGVVNLILAGFNLLPIGSLDGGRIVKLALNNYVSPNTSDWVLRAISFTLIVVCLGCSLFFAYRGIYNLTLLITAIYLIMLTIFENR